MSNNLTWREKAKVVISAVLAEHAVLDARALPLETQKELRKYIRKAYPFHRKRGYPYKAWCSAVAETFGCRLIERHSKKSRYIEDFMPSMREWAAANGYKNKPLQHN